jgi:hypothetical protein
MGLTRRRALVAGASAGLCLAAPAVARAATAERRFAILRGGDEVGFHTVRLTREGDALRAEIDIEIVVRFLGIAAYRYEMQNRELWRGGLLVSGDSAVNDDGERKRVLTRREDGRLIVDGANYAGPAPDDAATTTYFTRDFLTRPTWISTDAGDLLSVTRREIGPTTVETPAGPVEATRWRVTDGGAYDVNVAYDAAGEWLGLEFDAGGEPARYRVDRNDASFTAVWEGA